MVDVGWTPEGQRRNIYIDCAAQTMGKTMGKFRGPSLIHIIFLRDLEQQLSSFLSTSHYVGPGLPRTKGTRVAWVRRIYGDRACYNWH
jgi:hypothetical protein